MLKSFSESVQAADVCDSNAHMLRTLCCLYGVFGIVQYAGEFGLVSTERERECVCVCEHTERLLSLV